MWDVWFLGQIVCNKIEQLWIINKIYLSSNLDVTLNWRCQATEGSEFLISCKRLKLLRKAGRLQLIQNSEPSVAQGCQCDIRMGLIFVLQPFRWFKISSDTGANIGLFIRSNFRVIFLTKFLTFSDMIKHVFTYLNKGMGILKKCYKFERPQLFWDFFTLELKLFGRQIFLACRSHRLELLE